MRAASVLLDQVNGAFAREVGEIVESLERGDTASAVPRLETLAARCPLGRHLTTPWTVVLAGAPNVGKSSLLNALSGFKRAVVSAEAGTTRDVVAARLALDGRPVDVLDTAGQRNTVSVLERAGVERARAAAASADLCLWVLDGSAPPAWPAEDARPANVLWVVNKSDLPAAWDRSAAPNAVEVSAATGDGLQALIAAVSRRLLPEVPPPGAAVPFTPDRCQRVESALTLVRAGDAPGAAEVLTGARNPDGSRRAVSRGR